MPDTDDTAPASAQTEAQAQKLIKRHERNLRKARAEGFLDGILAMLRPGDLALDLGANMGEITHVLADTGADVWAFEPDPWSFARLSDRFGDRANVTLFNAAVGARAGSVSLKRADNFDANPEGASVKSTILQGGRSMDDDGGIDVPLLDFTQILADACARYGRVRFVKMDIEGAELEILETMDDRDLFDHVDCLVAETHENKFKALRPRFRALRAALGEKYPPPRVNLDWI
ncbi:FkbM family methyltransferase [Mesobaculum littorinae]|uniref:FkbM family methyltransferase n=1 Tax=Mesobaculum littorinae TaxID=2486419 RepID=A0A438AJ99_9RHOB|nr:FkbM family methyltransferase [Mesobaculum littorinae]RVV98853.1 FkbM family methyltransferase [Mesobaculum littorinae]